MLCKPEKLSTLKVKQYTAARQHEYVQFKTYKVMFIYLTEVVLGISKDPVATIEILNCDRHQRDFKWLLLTDKTSEKSTK